METLLKARLILCSLIIAAFFIPSYHGISALRFIPLAFSESETNTEIISTDVLLVVLPLLFVPLSSLGILLASWLKARVRKTFKAIPFICIITFISLLFIGLNSGTGSLSLSTFLLDLGPGFFLALISSLVLPFTKNPPKRRRRKYRSPSELEVAA